MSISTERQSRPECRLRAPERAAKGAPPPRPRPSRQNPQVKSTDLFFENLALVTNCTTVTLSLVGRFAAHTFTRFLAWLCSLAENLTDLSVHYVYVRQTFMHLLLANRSDSTATALRPICSLRFATKFSKPFVNAAVSASCAWTATVSGLTITHSRSPLTSCRRLQRCNSQLYPTRPGTWQRSSAIFPATASSHSMYAPLE